MTVSGERGWLVVVGLGPGEPGLLVPAAADALGAATDLVGYGPYLDMAPPGPPGQVRHASDNREELDRAAAALDLAAGGARVAVVSSGDPGVFAMAAAVYEALDRWGDERGWSAVDVRVVPGVTAAAVLASRVGAPLGHDFCLISLSDNLKPWELIERRVTAAAGADFVIALYNPVSKARPWQLGRAFELLLAEREPDTVVVQGRDVGRPAEAITVTTLGAIDLASVDMRTVLVVGSSTTRRVGGDGAVYTPRSHPG